MDIIEKDYLYYSIKAEEKAHQGANLDLKIEETDSDQEEEKN